MESLQKGCQSRSICLIPGSGTELSAQKGDTRVSESATQEPAPQWLAQTSDLTLAIASIFPNPNLPEVKQSMAQPRHVLLQDKVCVEVLAEGNSLGCVLGSPWFKGKLRGNHHFEVPILAHTQTRNVCTHFGDSMPCP